MTTEEAIDKIREIVDASNPGGRRTRRCARLRRCWKRLPDGRFKLSLVRRSLASRNWWRSCADLARL